MLNKVTLVGRLTRDPDLRYLGDGTPVVRFTLAVNRTFKNKAGERDADFINIVVWRKQAENCANYIGKGSLVAVCGRLQSRSYLKDDEKRYVTEVIAQEVHFLDSRKRQEQHDDFPDDLYPIDGDEEELPF